MQFRNKRSRSPTLKKVITFKSPVVVENGRRKSNMAEKM